MKPLLRLLRTFCVYGFVAFFTVLTRILKRCLDLSHSLAM